MRQHDWRWVAGGLWLSLACAVSAQDCQQQRFTPAAPADMLALQNPLPASRATLRDGKRLYRTDVDGPACVACHGSKGDGKGALAAYLGPTPRNFTCPAMADLPDGQLFWIIRNGSPDTAMRPHPSLSDEQIWQLVHFLRHFNP